MTQILKQINSTQVQWQDKVLQCRVGRNGFAKQKQEGDGCTPIGNWQLMTVYYRPDKIARPKTALQLVEITPDMGWSDDPQDSAYNTCITLPHTFSHEKLWRDDDLYDLVITTGHNTNPTIAGDGSAIFVHQIRENLTPTDGCLALKFVDLLYLVETVSTDTCWFVGQELG